MAKSGQVPEEVLEDLAAAFDEMKVKRSRIEREIRRRFQEEIEAAIAKETRVVERAFAVQFEEARQQGATRKELVKIIGDGTAEVFRRYVELGGGSVGVRRSEPVVDLPGVVRTESGFALQHPAGAVLVRVEWRDGKPLIWPVEAEDVVTLRERFGYTRADLYAKGAEIARVFKLKEG